MGSIRAAYVDNFNRVLGEFGQGNQRCDHAGPVELNATQRANYHYMADAMRRLEHDLHNMIEATNRIPLEWHEMARDRPPRRKVKVTLLLEEDVVKFMKSMGTGHGARINDVLRVWMHGRLAGVIRGADTIDYFKRGQKYHDGDRPMWGETGRWLDGDPEPTTAEKLADLKARLKERGRQMQVEE
jgi:uncharacterized protein (DUF4415 family)